MIKSNPTKAIPVAILRSWNGWRDRHACAGWISGIGGIATLLMLLPNGGCSIVRVLYAPQLTEHKSITLTVRRDTSMVAVADTVVKLTPPVEVPVAAPSGTATKPRIENPAHAAATPDTTSVPPTETIEQPATIAAPAPPSVSIALPAAQRQRLERLTRAEMGMAESITTQIAPRLTTSADQEKLRTVQGLIEQTHAALDRDDIQAAANLAHKAKLLATELLAR
jgi:hypothetical protein